MNNNGYVTKLNGTPIYAISAKEYVKMRLNVSDVYNAEYIYMIVDRKNYLIQGNRVMGQALDHCRRVKRMNGPEWTAFLKIDIETYQAKNVVITERPTVEFLGTEGEKKLNQVVAETHKVVNTGEETLQKLANEGKAALAAQVANTEAVVKRTTSRRSTSGSRKKRVKEEL